MLGSIVGPFSLQNRSQDDDGVKFFHFFLEFVFFVPLEVPPGSDFMDLGSILAPILKDFKTIRDCFAIAFTNYLFCFWKLLKLHKV